MLKAMILNAPRVRDSVTEQPTETEWLTARAAWMLIGHMVPFSRMTFYRRIENGTLGKEGVRIQRTAGASVILVDSISLLEWARRQRLEE